eukprot:m.404398 g.404398  ORF g.404398 m.404398 type:complete len:67 (+) comp16792_c0_seq4:1782-1982(+)
MRTRAIADSREFTVPPVHSSLVRVPRAWASARCVTVETGSPIVQPRPDSPILSRLTDFHCDCVVTS